MLPLASDPGRLEPLSADGCWSGDCIDPSWCSEVSSCAACPEGTICVLDADGTPGCSSAGCHYESCYMATCANQDVEVTCDCARAVDLHWRPQLVSRLGSRGVSLRGALMLHQRGFRRGAS
ncbi:MAG: hypothetical protein JW751_04125 [Polyangiaceae bacterium]|nr:hypothetical protein [Polyangiaceae bacterium]